jgi:5-formyltetrahydrofolate cyclo-ligase
MGPSPEPAADGDADTALREAKKALRVKVAERIAALKPIAREHKMRSLAAFALRAPPLGGRGLVLAYRAMDDEACVDELAETLAAYGWRVAFPFVDATGAMKLVELAAGPGLPPLLHASRWMSDRHGIRAPRLDGAGARSVWPRELDAVLVPARAFDRAGNRLGRGKGYYDRLLSRLRPDARGAAIGIAYAEQIEETVPTSGDDRPVAWIATDRGLTRARRVAR